MKKLERYMENKPGIEGETFYLELNENWITNYPVDLEVSLEVGKDIEFIGKSEREGEGFKYTYKAISEKAKRLLGGK